MKHSSTVLVLLYQFLFAFWISVYFTSVKKSHFLNFHLNSLQHKMNDSSKFPTISAKQNWVHFKCTNSVYQEAYHKLILNLCTGICNFTEEKKPLYDCFSVYSPIHPQMPPNFGVSNASKRREKGEIFHLGQWCPSEEGCWPSTVTDNGHPCCTALSH